MLTDRVYMNPFIKFVKEYQPKQNLLIKHVRKFQSNRILFINCIKAQSAFKLISYLIMSI